MILCAFNLVFSKFYAVFPDLSSFIGSFYSFSVGIIVLTHVGRFMHLEHVYFCSLSNFFSEIFLLLSADENSNIGTTWVLLLLQLLWRNCRTCLPKILFSVFMFAFIFSLPLIFTWPLAFLIFSPPLWNFHVFLATKFVSFVFNHSL